jgi:hypothetical protein
MINDGSHLHAIDVGSYRSVEVDTLDDLHTAESIFI